MLKLEGGENMKIYFINSVVDYGSTGKIVRDLSNELLLNNHQTRIAYGRKVPLDSSNTFSIKSNISFGFHYFMSRLFDRHGLHSTHQTKRLIKDIKNFNPDIIHIHNLHGYYLNVPLLLNKLKLMPIKIIVTLHDSWLISGSNASFDYAGCKVWDDGCVISNNPKAYPISQGFQRQSKNFEWKKSSFKDFNNLTFISPSKWLKDIMETSFLKEYPIEVVHNGIDTSIFYERKDNDLAKLYQDDKVILGVANVWTKEKGLADMLELANRLDDTYKVILIGLTDKQISELPSNVIGIKRTSNADELAKYYSLALAYINPTYEDNYPTTNLEARACNTPLIAYDTGGNKEIKDAVIVPQADIDGLVSAIKYTHTKLVNHEDYSKELFIKEMLKHYTK